MGAAFGKGGLRAQSSLGDTAPGGQCSFLVNRVDGGLGRIQDLGAVTL